MTGKNRFENQQRVIERDRIENQGSDSNMADRTRNSNKQNKRNKENRCRPFTAALVLMISLLLAGCGRDIVFTSEPVTGELFAVGDAVASDAELRVYYTNLQKEYENRFGGDIWYHEGNEPLAEAVLDNAMARLSKVKALRLLAAERGIELTEEETALTAQAAQDYYDSLNEAELGWFGITQTELQQMYEDYALAVDVYRDIIAEVNAEISDDEARAVTIQSILIRTEHVAPSGQATPFSEEEKAAARQKALDIRQEIRDGIANLTGVSFDEYVARYNEDGTGTMTFSRGEVDPALEEAAFALPVGEISDVIETQDGYRIIKCTQGYDPEQTQENKKDILRRRQETHFEEVYNAFVEDLHFAMDKKAFSEITLAEDPQITTDSFFATYERYFE